MKWRADLSQINNIVLSYRAGELDPGVRQFLLLVRLAINSPAAAVAPPIDEPIDWQRIWGLAEAHGLLSLLGGQLVRITESLNLPDEFCAALKDYSYANKLRNRMLLQEYAVVRAAFDEAGINTVALKGIGHLLTMPDYAKVRELADIDLLVPSRHVAKARMLLEQQGYRAVYAPNTVRLGEEDLTDEQSKVYDDVYHEYSFVNSDGLIYIDLHWRLSPRVYPTSLPADLPFVKQSSDGLPSLSYQLVYLCMHAAKDGWSELKWALDLATIARNFSNSDWAEAWELASRYRLRRILLTGIALTDWLTGESCVGAKQLSDSASIYLPSDRTLRNLRRRLVTEPNRKHRRISCLGLNKTYIALCDGNQDRLIYVYRMFTYPQPRDFVRLGLTDRWLPIWGLLRPFLISLYCLRRSLQILLLGRAQGRYGFD
jgi:hypothetical protein